jgi:N utilization substance protein B
MLSRRILRIKAFKAVYGIAENPGITLKEAEAELEKSCEATRDLYLFLMALCPALKEEAMRRAEAGRSKFNPTPEEKNPNMKFIGNRIPALLSDDPDFIKLISRKHMSWDQYDVFLRHLYDAVSSRDWFVSYMNSPESGVREDAELFMKIFSEELEDSEELASILEDLSIWWNDDL